MRCPRNDSKLPNDWRRSSFTRPRREAVIPGAGLNDLGTPRNRISKSRPSSDGFFELPGYSTRDEMREQSGPKRPAFNESATLVEIYFVSGRPTFIRSCCGHLRNSPGMYASNLQELLFHCRQHSDMSPQIFAEFTERFNALRSYGHLPKGRDQRKRLLTPIQIASAILG